MRFGIFKQLPGASMRRNRLKMIITAQVILILVLGLPCLLNTYKPLLFVTSDSMAPEIPAGSIIVIKNDTDAELSTLVGQPFVFFDPIRKKHIVHRAIKSEGEYLITRGDANFFVDHLRVSREHILGRVVWTITFLTRVMGPFALFVFLLLLLMNLLREGRSGKRPIWKSLCLPFAIILLMLVFGECCVRIWMPQSITTFYDYDAVLGWKNQPSTQRANLNPEYQTTSTVGPQGFRGSPFVPKAKPAHQKRILVLGDSYTWGEGVNDDETYSYLLEEYMPNETWVLNAGVDGYGTDQEYLFLKEVGYQFQPDIVILAICPNDFENNTLNVSTNQLSRKPRFDIIDGELVLRDIPAKRKGMGLLFDRTTRSFKHHSHFYHLLKKAYGIWRYRHAVQDGDGLLWEKLLHRDLHKARKQGGYQNEGQALLAPYLKDWPEQIENSWRITRELILKTRDLSSSVRADFILVVIPYAVEVYPEDWDFWQQHFALEKKDYDFEKLEGLFRSFAQEQQLDYILLRDHFKMKEERLFFERDFHLNAAGHQATAEAIHLYLKN
jgi:signal peptidase I